MDDSTEKNIGDREALRFHSRGKPGKLEINPTKPMATQRDLSLAYSPGVAVPVRAISDNPDASYDLTSRGNMVAVISNGTAILGLGNLGALASKPVMEGKAVLFKRFADVDSIDLEIDTEDPDQFINAVRYMGPSFGGINLEDIKAPDCFIIEQKLREEMDIPVFHDDQHGTAIICVAGLINALHLTGRDIKETKVVMNGAGAAGIACLELLKAMGLPSNNAILCDTKGVIFTGREEGMNQWKSAHAVKTDSRTLAEAMQGADIFIGLSVKGALTGEMLKSMAKDPIIFAMANPDPEITPEEAHEIRPDAIVATGRSDYPNQVNNVLGFPYIFRGALDVQATTINEEMKIACAEALAALAREDVPDEVAAAYNDERLRFGPNYIIPVPFDPRLIRDIPPAVAKAAMETGVARKPIVDMDAYRDRLSARLDPAAGSLQVIFNKVRQKPKRMIFAEGEQEQVIRAAIAYKDAGLGEPVLIGRDEIVLENMKSIGLGDRDDLEIANTSKSERVNDYAAYLYNRLQRKGFLERDVMRMVSNDRNIFGSCMLALGDADAMITGVTRNYSIVLEQVTKVIDPLPGKRMIGVSMILTRGRTVLVADTNVHDMPNGEELADITEQTAETARALGYEPRVALLAYSTFGHPEGDRSRYVRDAIKILEHRCVDFEFDGEMAADVALNKDVRIMYPFSRLKDNANVLVMPAIHSASISTKMLGELGGATVIGPMLIGMSKPVQIVRIGCTSSELLNMAAIAAYDF
ncbi:MAG: NADP-dependent malic enzyme [Candidatus Micropelagos thuwalensis]